jgi:hypothetical protein
MSRCDFLKEVHGKNGEKVIFSKRNQELAVLNANTQKIDLVLPVPYKDIEKFGTYFRISQVIIGNKSFWIVKGGNYVRNGRGWDRLSRCWVIGETNNKIRMYLSYENPGFKSMDKMSFDFDYAKIFTDQQDIEGMLLFRAKYDERYVDKNLTRRLVEITKNTMAIVYDKEHDALQIKKAHNLQFDMVFYHGGNKAKPIFLQKTSKGYNQIEDVR